MQNKINSWDIKKRVVMKYMSVEWIACFLFVSTTLNNCCVSVIVSAVWKKCIILLKKIWSRFNQYEYLVNFLNKYLLLRFSDSNYDLLLKRNKFLFQLSDIMFWMLLLLSHFSRVRLCATHRRKPTSLPCPWDSPDKNTGVGCHFLELLIVYTQLKRW